MEPEGSRALLSQADPPAVRLLRPEAVDADFLIVCDHAGRAVPSRLGQLGLPPEAFEQHIAWDIGAGAVAANLSERLGAPALLQTYSRLVIDCNRRLDDAEAIAKVSDGYEIPGNAKLEPADIKARQKEIFHPYHDAIAGRLAGSTRTRPVMISVHSFTPELKGERRPWAFGVLHDGRSPVSSAMTALLRAASQTVGDNQPYAMDGTDYTVPRHAMANGLDYLELEIRQDLISDAAGQAWAASLLARLLPLALKAGA